MAEPPKRPHRPSQAARPSTASPVGQRPSQIDRAMALRDAVEQAMEAEKGFKKRAVVQTSKARLVAMLVVGLPLLVFSTYSWVARPAFIWGTAPPIPVVQQQANMRMTLYVLGMRVNKYRAAQGFYPASLEALGEPATGITYEQVADSVFELRGVVDREPIVYRSDMNAREFLGNAQDVLSHRKSR